MPHAYCDECGAYRSTADLMEKRKSFGRTALVCRDDRACENRDRERRGHPPRFR